MTKAKFLNPKLCAKTVALFADKRDMLVANNSLLLSAYDKFINANSIPQKIAILRTGVFATGKVLFTIGDLQLADLKANCPMLERQVGLDVSTGFMSGNFTLYELDKLLADYDSVTVVSIS